MKLLTNVFVFTYERNGIRIWINKRRPWPGLSFATFTFILVLLGRGIRNRDTREHTLNLGVACLCTRRGAGVWRLDLSISFNEVNGAMPVNGDFEQSLPIVFKFAEQRALMVEKRVFEEKYTSSLVDINAIPYQWSMEPYW